MTVGEIIRNARERKGWTQEQLGEAMGVQKSAIAKWENNRVVNIKREKLQQLADVLEISPHLLVMPEPRQEEPATSPVLKEIAGYLSEMTPEQLAQVATYIRFIKSGG